VATGIAVPSQVVFSETGFYLDFRDFGLGPGKNDLTWNSYNGRPRRYFSLKLSEVIQDSYIFKTNHSINFFDFLKIF
jgi:hypothetical protein